VTDFSVRKALPAALLLVLVLAGLIAGSAAFYRHQLEHARKTLGEELVALCAIKSEQLVAWRAERAADGGVLADSPLVAAAAAQWGTAPEADKESPLAGHLRSVQSRYAYRDVQWIEPDGRIPLSQSGATGFLQSDDLDALITARRTGQAVLSDFRAGPEGRSLELTITAPVFDRRAGQASLLGAARLVVDAKASLFPLLRTGSGPLEGADILLARLGTGADRLFLSTRDSGSGPKRLDQGDPGETIDLQSQPGERLPAGTLVEARDAQGRALFVSSCVIPGSVWSLVASVDSARAFAPSRQRVALTLASLLSALGFLALLGLVFWRRRHWLQSQVLSESESARRESEARLSTLFEQMPDPAWIIAEGRFVEANSAALRALGCPDKSAFLRLDRSSVSPRFQPDGELSSKKAARMVALARKDGRHRFDWVHQSVVGTPLRVEVMLAPIDWDGGPALLYIWRDMSEHEKMLNDLQASEAKFRTLFESSNDAVLLRNAQGYFDCNRKALELFGCSSAADLGSRDPADLSPPTQPDGRASKAAADAYVRKALKEGYCQFEWLSRRSDGTLFPSACARARRISSAHGGWPSWAAGMLICVGTS
jgi:PAS domain S-box-containing protein